MRAVLDATPLSRYPRCSPQPNASETPLAGDRGRAAAQVPESGPAGGVRRYVSELARALTESFPEDRFILVSDQPFMPVPGVRYLDARPAGLHRRWWSWGLLRTLSRMRADVFHGTDFAVPYLPLRASVMTLHDLSPWIRSDWQAASERVRRRTALLLRFGIPTMIITPTEAVRAEAIHRFHLHPSRVVAVGHGASAAFRRVPPPAGRRKPYFLHVGTLEARKNVAFLISAWRETRKRHDVELVLVGRLPAGISPPPREEGLVVLGETPDSDLAALYSGALALLCASHYEGFCLPVLEAMQCGTPVIAASDPAIAEVGGEAAVLLSLGDPRAWPEVMAAAMEKPLWRKERGEHCLERASTFSWSRAAQRTREVYEEAIRRFGR